jgi:dUTP pyrophosphatase
MNYLKVGYRALRPEDKDLLPPRAATTGASGVDLAAAIKQELVIHPGETKAIPTGLQLEIPKGYEAQVRPRSGLALKHSVGILNSPGTIDSDYRGEIQVILTNFGQKDFIVRRGDRIAQLVFQQVILADFIPKDAIAETNRGAGGFGHTG